MSLNMQNYTYFEQISKTIFKSAFLGLFFEFYSTLPPPLKQKVLPPPPREKSESPPCRPIFYPPPTAHHRAQVWWGTIFLCPCLSVCISISLNL